MQWLFWQMSGLDPIAGQSMHFVRYATENMPYTTKRYVNKTSRLFKVMDTQFVDRDYLAGEYSIADMASYPWVKIYSTLQQDLNDYPNLNRWYENIKAKPAVIRAYAKSDAIQKRTTKTKEAIQNLKQCKKNHKVIYLILRRKK